MKNIVAFDMNRRADMPMVMYSFFDEYDFSGKTIIPFNVHNGSRFSGTIETIRELEPNVEVITDGFTVSERVVADADKDVEGWLKGLCIPIAMDVGMSENLDY